jgi:APA family basic amino acid/polyamine antiporter
VSHRRLKRQLGLLEILMLGSAGTIAAEVFVLTGHIAGMSGPAGVLAVALVGLLNVGIALNYCEMGTAFPVTGGALTYVREAFGTNLLSFLVGSMDCLSSAFYAALSAVGFAYSLRIFIPGLPIVPAALVTAAAFTLLNALGVVRAGRAQVALGAVLLSLLGAYVVFGLTRPQGFAISTLLPEGRFFVGEGLRANLGALLSTMALIFNAYVGYELIADDAEELKNPNRNLPLGILVSLAIITVYYVLISLVTLGTVPWQQLAGSEEALARAAARFLPTWGPALVGVAGIIATLSSVNTAILSATREALTLSRDGHWPLFLSRLGSTRNPVAASLTIGVIVALITVIGLVRFLSYISSSGYLFVVFWATLAMVKLRHDRPDLARPFKVPLFPLTPILAALGCVLVVAFTDWRPLLFGAGVLAALAVYYKLRGPLGEFLTRGNGDLIGPPDHESDRIVVAAANPHTAESLANLALALAQRAEDTSVLMLNIVPANLHRALPRTMPRLLERRGQIQRALLERVAAAMQSYNIPFYTRTHDARDVAEGILREVGRHGNTKLLLMGWPGPLIEGNLLHNPVRRVLQQAPTNVAVFLDRGLGRLRSILVPVSTSPHARLAVRLALELAQPDEAKVVALRCYTGDDTEEMHDELLMVRELLQEEFGEVPPEVSTRVIAAPTVREGIQRALAAQPYDLVVMGAALAYAVQSDLFGSLSDQMAEQIPCSILLARRYEPMVITWLRRRVRQLVRV